MDLRMQGFDPPAQNFGKAGDGTDGRYRQTGGFQCFLRAARGYQFHPVGGEEAGEIHQTVFVGHAQDGATNGKHIHMATPLAKRSELRE